jgi:hypothetical protein
VTCIYIFLAVGIIIFVGLIYVQASLLPRMALAHEEGVGKQAHAELALEMTFPEQALDTYDGKTLTSATKVLVKTPQNS